MHQSSMFRSQSRLQVNGDGTLSFSFPRDDGALADLKARIPQFDRKWNGAARVWVIDANHAAICVDIAKRHFGDALTMPAVGNVGPLAAETRVLTLKYLGLAKERADGQFLAYGWVDGGWGALFPRNVLKKWFSGTQDKPDEAVTLYTTLLLDHDATAEEIKRAYRRLAKQWHPDVTKEPDAAQQFQVIQHAYQVLSDPDMRERYDAGLALETLWRVGKQIDAYTNDRHEHDYRAPLRSGYVMAEGRPKVAGFLAEKILAWEDIVDAKGRTLVVSWVMGADRPTESWI